MKTTETRENDRRHKVRARGHRTRWSERWAWLVWTGVIAATGLLYLNNPDGQYTGRLRGLVEAETVNIGPVETAAIKSVLVREGARVRAGDLLVEMDTALIEHGITADIVDTIRIRSAFGDTHQDMLQSTAQRRDAIAALELEVATCEQEWRREAAELAALEEEQKRRDAMRSRNLVDETFRTELLPAKANLEKAVAEYPKRMVLLQRQLETARKDEREVIAWLGAKENESESDAVRRRLHEDAVEDRLKAAESQAGLHREAYMLRAPKDGLVSAILFRPGDVVAAGLPILRLVDERPAHITAYLNENQAGQLPVGAEVLVRSANRRPASTARAVVRGAGHEIHIIAYSADLAGRQAAMRGQRVRLAIDGPHEFFGGETVYLSPGRTDWKGLLLRLAGVDLPRGRPPWTPFGTTGTGAD